MHVFVVKILLIAYVVVVMLQVGGLLKDQIRFMRIYRTIFNIEIQIVLIYILLILFSLIKAGTT